MTLRKAISYSITRLKTTGELYWVYSRIPKGFYSIYLLRAIIVDNSRNFKYLHWMIFRKLFASKYCINSNFACKIIYRKIFFRQNQLCVRNLAIKSRWVYEWGGLKPQRKVKLFNYAVLRASTLNRPLSLPYSHCEPETKAYGVPIWYNIVLQATSVRGLRASTCPRLRLGSNGWGASL